MNIEYNDKILAEKAMQSLQDVYDPEIGLSITDLGLIYKLNFDESEKKIECTMTLTTEFCPMGESITAGVREALISTFPEWESSVHITFNPPWNQDRISEDGKNFLNR